MSQFSDKINKQLVTPDDPERSGIVTSFLRGEKADISRLFNKVASTPELLGVCLAFYRKIGPVSCSADTLKDLNREDTQQFIRESGQYFFEAVSSILVAADGTVVAETMAGAAEWDEAGADKQKALTHQFFCAIAVLLSMELVHYSADYDDHRQAISVLAFVITSFFNYAARKKVCYTTLPDVTKAFNTYINTKEFTAKYEQRLSADDTSDSYQWISARDSDEKEVDGFVWIKPDRTVVPLNFDNEQNPYCSLLQHLCDTVPEDNAEYYEVLTIVSEARERPQILVACFCTVFDAYCKLPYDCDFVIALIDAANSACIKNDEKKALIVHVLETTFSNFSTDQAQNSFVQSVNNSFFVHGSNLAGLDKHEFFRMSAEQRARKISHDPIPAAPEVAGGEDKKSRELPLENKLYSVEPVEIKNDRPTQASSEQRRGLQLPENDLVLADDQDDQRSESSLVTVEIDETSSRFSIDSRQAGWQQATLIAASGALMVAVGACMFITIGVGVEITGIGIAYIKSALIIGGCLQIGAGSLQIAELYARANAWFAANPKFHKAAKVLTALALIGIGVAVMVTTWGIGSAISIGLMSVATEILGGVLGAGLMSSGLFLAGPALWCEVKNVLPAYHQSTESASVKQSIS